jgi:hypothetical protein
MKAVPIPNQSAIKTSRGMELDLHTFLTGGRDIDECSTSRSGRLNPVKEPPVSLYETMSGPQIQSGLACRKHA